jgi:uncharacterized membrane protein
VGRIKRAVRGRRRDERGAVLIFTAVSMVVLLWAGAMGVDIGFSVFGSRQAQAMADTAAVDLARYINIADQQCLNCNGAVQSYLNGKLANVLTDNASHATLTVTPGLWLNGAWSIPALGCAPTFPPAVNPCNAVKVTAAQSVPQIFFGGFNVLSGHSGSTAGGATAAGTTIAAVTPEAGFSIGSFLLNINSQQSAVLNAVLGPLDSSANVTAVGYDGLANTSVTINQLITASGGLLTPSNVMTTTLTGAQWLAIWTDAVSNQVAQLNCGSAPTPDPCNAGTALSALGFSGSSVQLCQLVSVNGSTCANGALSTPALSASLNVLQMLTTEAELANGTSALDVTSALSITGVTTAKLYLTLIQPPAVRFGLVGTTAKTAQLQADLQLTLPTLGVLDIPLTAASGTATLKAVNCTNNAFASTKIAATTTTATAAVTLAGASVATLNISGYSGGPVSFGAGVVPPTATTAAADSNPITVGTNGPIPTFTATTANYNLPVVNNLLTSLLPPVLGPILQAAGVTVGGAEVATLSANCGAVSVVQ